MNICCTTRGEINKVDAIKFINERNRMCKNFVNGCKGCPAFNACDKDLSCAVGNESMLDVMEQIAIVEKWSKENPRKTKQDSFLEQYPEAALDAYGVLRVCPLGISAAHRDSDGGCKNPYDRCDNCRREFWMHEVG